MGQQEVGYDTKRCETAQHLRNDTCQHDGRTGAHVVSDDVIEIFRSSFVFQAKTNAILYHENIEAQIDPTADFLAALGVSGKYS